MPPQGPSYIELLRQRQAQPTQGPGRPLPAAPTAPSPLEEEDPSTWGRILDVLSAPGQASSAAAMALAKGRGLGDVASEALSAGWNTLKGDNPGLSYADVLQELGWQEPGKLNTAAGFGLDVLLDPTNLIPGKVFATAAKGLGTGMKATGNLVAKAPLVGKPIDSALNAIVPFRNLRNLPEEYQKLAQVRNLESRASRSLAFHEQADALKPLLQATRVAGKDPIKTAEEAMKTAMQVADGSATGPVTPEVQALVDYIKKFASTRAQKEVAAGVLEPGMIKPNYVPKRRLIDDDYNELRTATHTGKRTFLHDSNVGSFKKGEADGVDFNYNMIAALGKRQFEGDLAIAQQKFMDQIFDPKASPELQGLAVTRQPGAPVPTTADGRKFLKFKSQAFNKATQKAFSEKWIHPDVVKDFTNMLSIPQRAKGFAKSYDDIMNIWKSNATVVRPAFIQRNLLSNLYMSLAGGETKITELPRYYKEAIEHIAQGKYANDPIFQRAKELGITSTEFGAIGELGDQASHALGKLLVPLKERLDPRIPGNFVKPGDSLTGRALDAARTASKHVEDTSRLALYLQQVKSAKKSPEDAAIYVNKWLLNYAEKSPFERQVLGRIFPFSTWMTRIVPRIVEGAVRNPQLVSAQDKLKNAIEAGVPDSETMSDAQRPDWMNEQGMFQMPSNEPGVRKFGGLGLPGQDLNIIPIPGFGTSPFTAGRELLGRISPAKAPIEAITGYDLQTGGRVWQTHAGELKQASGTLDALAKAAEMGKMQDLLHAVGMAKQGENWLAPAYMNQLSKQLIPVAEQITKGFRAPMPGEQGKADTSLLGFDMNPVLRNILWGVPTVQSDTDVNYARRIQSGKAELIRRLRDQAMVEESRRKAREGR